VEEERNFETRKNLLEYDEVMTSSASGFTATANESLNGANCKVLILEMIDQQVNRYLGRVPGQGLWHGYVCPMGQQPMATEVDASNFRGLDFETADRIAKEEAQRIAESEIFDEVEKNLPDGVEESEWNWEALVKLVNTRW